MKSLLFYRKGHEKDYYPLKFLNRASSLKLDPAVLL